MMKETLQRQHDFNPYLARLMFVPSAQQCYMVVFALGEEDV